MKFLLWFSPMLLGLLMCMFSVAAGKSGTDAALVGVLLMAIAGFIFYGTHRQRT